MAWFPPRLTRTFPALAPGPDRYRCRAGEPREGVLVAEPVHTGDLAHDQRRGQHPAPRDGQQRRRLLDYEPTQLTLELDDLDVQRLTALKEPTDQIGDSAGHRLQPNQHVVDHSRSPQPTRGYLKIGVQLMEVPTHLSSDPCALTYQVTPVIGLFNLEVGVVSPTRPSAG